MRHFINKERYVKDLLRKYDTIGSSVNTQIVPPNMVGPDLNDKVVNESQYRGMIRSLINLTTSRPDIQFSTESQYKEKALQMLVSCLKASLFAEDIEFHFIPIQYQLVDIFTKPLDEPTFKRLIVELVEFWFSSKALENFKVSFSTLTGDIYGEVGEAVPTKGTLKKSLLPPRWRLLMAQIIQCLGGKTGGFDQITNKDAIILYSLVNKINIDYASIFWEDIIIILNKKHRENVVPYTRFLSLLMMHKMKEGYEDGELTLYPT
ncbi:hypothetical protein Tco_0759651 [Tanacetum coccineum]